MNKTELEKSQEKNLHNPLMSKMQISRMYSVYDNKAENFQPPFLMINHAVAIRAFTEYVNDPKSEIYKYPGDYDLYYIGEFNKHDGKFISNSVEKISNGEQVKEKTDNN